MKKFFRSISLLFLFYLSISNSFSSENIYKGNEFDDPQNVVSAGLGYAPVRIELKNYTGSTWQLEGYKILSGKILEEKKASDVIENREGQIFVASSRQGALIGSEGTLAYRMVDTNNTLRFYWRCGVARGSKVVGDFYSDDQEIIVSKKEITGAGLNGSSSLTFKVESVHAAVYLSTNITNAIPWKAKKHHNNFYILEFISGNNESKYLSGSYEVENNVYLSTNIDNAIPWKAKKHNNNFHLLEFISGNKVSKYLSGSCEVENNVYLSTNIDNAIPWKTKKHNNNFYILEFISGNNESKYLSGEIGNNLSTSIANTIPWKTKKHNNIYILEFISGNNESKYLSGSCEVENNLYLSTNIANAIPWKTKKHNNNFHLLEFISGNKVSKYLSGSCEVENNVYLSTDIANAIPWKTKKHHNNFYILEFISGNNESKYLSGSYEVENNVYLSTNIDNAIPWKVNVGKVNVVSTMASQRKFAKKAGCILGYVGGTMIALGWLLIIFPDPFFTTAVGVALNAAGEGLAQAGALVGGLRAIAGEVENQLEEEKDS
jgi:hypothetical protein